MIMKIDAWEWSIAFASLSSRPLSPLFPDLFSVFWLVELKLHADNGKQDERPVLQPDPGTQFPPLEINVFTHVFFESVNPSAPEGLSCISSLDADFEHKQTRIVLICVLMYDTSAYYNIMDDQTIA